jgi:aspartate oxidase
MKYPEIAKLGLWKKFGIFKENERLRQQVEDLHEVVQKQIYANTELRQKNVELVEALEISADGFMNCGAEDLEDMCRAAIAKATGGE